MSQPFTPPAPQNLPAVVPPQPRAVSAGGLVAIPLASVQQQERARRESQDIQAMPIASGIAAHITRCFSWAQMARRNTIDERLWDSIRARRGEYKPEKLAEIRDMGGSEVWAGITGEKCRAAGGWLRDILMGSGSERPWEISPTPLPDLPPAINDEIINQAMGPIREQLQAGQAPSQQQVVQMVSMLRDQALSAIRDEARKRADRMSDKMETQLDEGGFRQALDAFIDDLVTYPTAFMKGPVIRNCPTLSWGPDGQPVVMNKLVKTWERVSPFNLYPSPGADTVQDGYLIERHRLSRQALNEMIGVDGYQEAAIRQVLEQYDNGLTSWFFDISQQQQAEGKDTLNAYQNPDGLIDALQYWGSVPGRMLTEWGMPGNLDPTQEYHVEAWLIGSYVIRAVINYDPLNRKPYYAASYERVPGNIWGNSVADLVRDAQDITNAAARSLVNNMALASGPQVGILVDRLAQGEDITQVAPWRIWQMKSDPMNGTTQQPIQFFQPNSNVQELLAVFDRFSQMADEYSGIPRYLTGDTTGGAGRTASGLSMLINNAGKSIKQVINNVDAGLIEPVLERLYYYNMRYEDDPDLKGDVCIVARGAAMLEAKEAAQVRRNEFLAATNNPIDFQITGIEGRAAVLREVAKGLDMNVDRIVPPQEVLQQKFAAQAEITQGGAVPPGPTGAQPPPPNGASPAQPSTNRQQLMDSQPVTDNFTPPKGP